MGHVLSDDIINVINNSIPSMQVAQTGTELDKALGGFLKDGSVSVAEMVEQHRTITKTITSAAAATAINILADVDVPAGKKVYLKSFHAKVNGSTVWATTATVKIQDTEGTPIDFVTMAVAALTANAVITAGIANVTLENAFILGSGGTAAKGLQLKGNANGTGSDLVVTVNIVVK